MGFGPRLQMRVGRDPDFRAIQKHFADNQFTPQKGQIVASDPKVLRFQQRIINRRILDRHVLQMKTVPGSKADPKHGNRIAEIFADDFPQPHLSARGLDVKIDGQQPQPKQAGNRADGDQRCLNDTFRRIWKNADATVREPSTNRQEQALESFHDDGCRRQIARVSRGNRGEVAASAVTFSAKFTEETQGRVNQSVRHDFTAVIAASKKRFVCGGSRFDQGGAVI